MEKSWSSIAEKTVRMEASVVGSLVTGLDPGAFDVAARLILTCAGKVLTGGAGTSHAVAWRLAHLLCCCGVPATFMHPGDAIHGGSGLIAPDDVVVLVSKGGQSQEVNAVARIARCLGASVIAVSGTASSPLADLADVVLVVPTPEDADLHGTIATGSSLAACALCDAICAVVASERGYSTDQFSRIHPGGAVGRRLAKIGRQQTEGGAST